MALNDINITKNIKTIERLKSEILTNTAELFSSFSKEKNLHSQEVVLSAVSNIIIDSYLLAKRMGFDFSQVDSKIDSKLSLELKSNEVEKDFGDISCFIEYLQDSSARREG